MKIAITVLAVLAVVSAGVGVNYFVTAEIRAERVKELEAERDDLTRRVAELDAERSSLSASVDDLAELIADLNDRVDAVAEVPSEAPIIVAATEDPDPEPITLAVTCSPYYEGGTVGCERSDGTAICGGGSDIGPCSNEVVCPDDPHWCWTNCDTNHYPRDQWYAEIRAGIRDRGCPDQFADGQRECISPGTPGAGLYIDGFYVQRDCV